MVIKRWQKLVGAILGIVLVLAIVADRIVTVAVNEMYSPEWHSASADEAGANGVLAFRPAIQPATVVWGGVPLTVRDAWVEQRSHWSYRFYLVRRVIRDDRYRLIVRMTRIPPGKTPTVDALGGAEWLAYGDSLRFDTWAGAEYWMRTVEPPFPDTVRLIVRHR